MNRPRIIQWAVAGGVCVALAVGFALSRKGDRLTLPAVAHYENLPDLFHRTLKEAREKAGAAANDPAAWRRLARLYQANRLYQEARDSYQSVAATATGLTARDHYYLADIAQNENDLAGAQKELRLVLQREPGYGPARLALAQSLFKSGEEKEAEKEFSALLAVEPDQAQASLGLVRIHLQRGHDDLAVERLEELIAAHPESTSAAALLAQVLERRGETDRTIALRQWSLQRPEPIPADPWMAELLADLYDVQLLGLKFEDYSKTGQVDEAMVFLRRIEELAPGSFVAPLLRGSSEAQARHYREAVPHFREALAKGGDPERIGPALAEALLALDHVAEAAELMAGYYAKTPDSIPIAKAYAEIVVRQGNDAVARKVLIRLLAKEPYLHVQNMSLARILWVSGERDAAAQCLQRIVAVQATDVASRALLGEYYLGKSDPTSAIGPLEQALAQATAPAPVREHVTEMLATAYLQAGNGEAEKGHFAEAVDYAEKASKLSPADLNVYALKANGWVQLKQFRRAAEALAKMAALQPGNPTIHLSWGDVLYQDGDAAQANRQWQQALQSVPPGADDLRAALRERLEGRITPETFQ